MLVIYTNAPSDYDNANLVRKTTKMVATKISPNEVVGIRKVWLVGKPAELQAQVDAYIMAGHVATPENPAYDVRMEALENFKRFVASAPKNVLKDALAENPSYAHLIHARLEELGEEPVPEVSEQEGEDAPRAPKYVVWDGAVWERRELGFVGRVHYMNLLAGGELSDALYFPHLANLLASKAMIVVSQIPPMKVLKKSSSVEAIHKGDYLGNVVWRVEGEESDIVFDPKGDIVSAMTDRWETIFDESSWTDALTWMQENTCGRTHERVRNHHRGDGCCVDTTRQGETCLVSRFGMGGESAALD